MTSSNSNSSNRLLDFNETNPVLGFNTTPFSASASASSGSNVSRARFMKARKQTVSHNHKSGNQVFRSSTQSVFGDIGYGNAAKDMFLFGGNEGGSYSSYCGLDKGDSNVIVDDMSRLNIDSNKGDSAFGLQAFGLKGSDVEGVSDVKSTKGSLGVDAINTNQFTSSVDGNAVLEMQSEMKKMDVKDPADVSSEGGFRGYEKTGEFAFTSRLDDVRFSNVEFKTPDMRKNMFSGLNRFEPRKEHGKETRSKKKKGKQESGGTSVFSFGSRSEDVSNDNFTFATSSSGQSQLPSDTRQHKKKPPLKITRDSYISTKPEFFPVDLSASSSIKKDNLKLVNEQDFRHESLTSSSLSSSKAAEEACEKWRLRGNQAYSNGDLAKAEDCYTQGLNSISENEKSTSCLRALMLCYSNRAAARMSTGRMKEALEDCLMAAAIDPNFLKVQVRAAHCYLAMGEIENAKQQYMKCLQFRNDNSADGKVIAEASEGLEKVQKVLDCIDQCTDLLQRRASEDLESALRLINDALHISTCSNKLLQMKADSLFMLRRYEEVIQILTSDKADTPANSSSRTWRSHLIIKSYFYLGRLDEALEFINKQESAIPLADTIRELLSHKMAGNEAYKSGKHSEAVEHYTAALSCSVESRPFVSVCFCNRAAAYRALGQITDGIADCSLAIALDPNYLKAISRRASLYEMIRDYGQAAKDLQRLVSLLTTQVEKGAVSGALDNLSCINELKQTQIQLSNVEMESRKGIPLNAYLILGVESTASAADIKKAYRKAALKHHPDKAAQLLGRGDDGDDGLWKKIAENVHKDADRLFKMIGEAYAVLSNPSKRSNYDQDEAKRNEVNRFTRSNSSRTAADVQNSVFEQSGNVRQWQDSATTYTRTQSTGSGNTGSSYTYSKYY
ncbi:putative DnaJ domain, tetratricopeptide-like helical domain superfamily [Helianthus debilis subsp. tardiflorus]